MKTKELPPAEMTDEALLEEGHMVVDKFDEYSKDDPFGWDWPTMAALFPDDHRRFQELRAEWKSRHRAASI